MVLQPPNFAKVIGGLDSWKPHVSQHGTQSVSGIFDLAHDPLFSSLPMLSSYALLEKL